MMIELYIAGMFAFMQVMSLTGALLADIDLDIQYSYFQTFYQLMKQVMKAGALIFLQLV